jgi:ankyrin repeat protein
MTCQPQPPFLPDHADARHQEKEAVVPIGEFPREPNLEHLRNQAKILRRRLLTGDTAARELVREFHPRLADADVQALVAVTLADAQLVIARQYRFGSWPRLRRHVEVVTRYARSPHRAPAGGPATTRCARAEEFLRLACLTYGGDNAARRQRARELLAAHPGIATASIHTMAAVGDVTAAAALLADDPAQASTPGGPHDWEPLLYLAYSRLDSTAAGHSTLEVARLLLACGADPDAGYLWEGTYAFTALTGALGEGEDAVNQPRHQFWLPLARLLLDAGADPNDSQGLYNRMFAAGDDHLRLLFSYGLGSGTGGPWYARLGSALPSPAQMLQDQLLWAAEHNLVARVTLLLAHDVDPDGLGFWFTGTGRRTAYQRAVLTGNTETAELLLAAGARRTPLGPAQELISACLSVDRLRVDGLVTADPTVVRQAIAAEPAAILRATELRRPDAIRLLAELGFDVNAAQGISALHEAASTGDLAMVDLLLFLGADPNQRDCSFDSTPLGWAEHGHHQQIIDRLTPVTERGPDRGPGSEDTGPS